MRPTVRKLTDVLVSVLVGDCDVAAGCVSANEGADSGCIADAACHDGE